MPLEAGLHALVRIVVADSDTAIALGSGDVPVLGTPRLLALAEAASVAAVQPSLDPGQTSVGTSAALEHKKASPLGAEVTVEAELIEADPRRLVFTFTARQDDAIVGAGTMERVIVDRDRFVARNSS